MQMFNIVTDRFRIGNAHSLLHEGHRYGLSRDRFGPLRAGMRMLDV